MASSNSSSLDMLLPHQMGAAVLQLGVQLDDDGVPAEEFTRPVAVPELDRRELAVAEDEQTSAQFRLELLGGQLGVFLLSPAVVVQLEQVRLDGLAQDARLVLQRPKVQVSRPLQQGAPFAVARLDLHVE